MAMSPDQTADLWLKIDQLHLNYLKSEENTNKLEIRKKLEGELILCEKTNRFCMIVRTMARLKDFPS